MLDERAGQVRTSTHDKRVLYQRALNVHVKLFISGSCSSQWLQAGVVSGRVLADIRQFRLCTCAKLRVCCIIHSKLSVSVYILFVMPETVTDGEIKINK